MLMVYWKLELLYETIGFGLLETSPPFEASVVENLEFEQNDRTSEACSTKENRNPNWTFSNTAEIKEVKAQLDEKEPKLFTEGSIQGFTSRNDCYETKSGRELLIEGRVFYVGKSMKTTNDARETKLKTSLMVEIKSSKGEGFNCTRATNEPNQQIPDEFYTTKFDREPIMEGKVFDGGKDTILTNVLGELGFEESLMKETCSSNGKSRTTSSLNEEKTPSMDCTPLPKKVKVHKRIPIDPVKDSGRSLRPPHKLKEKVNSKCSKVWKVKHKEFNQAWMVKNKSGGNC